MGAAITAATSTPSTGAKDESTTFLGTSGGPGDSGARTVVPEAVALGAATQGATTLRDLTASATMSAPSMGAEGEPAATLGTSGSSRDSSAGTVVPEVVALGVAAQGAVTPREPAARPIATPGVAWRIPSRRGDGPFQGQRPGRGPLDPPRAANR
ncbi:hypothetical protein ABZP36_022146 [Zizania latifolia]